MPTQMSDEPIEKQAGKIHRYLRTDARFNEKFLKRPFIFEFTGTPSAGKTTTIAELDKLFRRNGFRVYRPQESAEAMRDIERTSPLFNLMTGIDSIGKLVHCAIGHSYDIGLFDRGPYDAFAWMKYWCQKGRLARNEKDCYQRFFLSRFWTKFIDCAYFMVCDPEIAVQREHRIALNRKLGKTTNPKTLKMLGARYREAYQNLKAWHPQLRLYDSTRINERTMVKEIAQDLMLIMLKKSTAK